MSQSLSDRYRRWFEYEKDSHAKVLASLHSVPESQRSTPAFQRAVTLLAHLVEARRMWLYRFGVAQEAPREFFPSNVALPDLAARLEATQTAWSKYHDRLDETELARTFEYQSLDAGRFRSTVEDVLTQLFGHSWYHRGQIASLVRAAGGEPAVTDFIFWSREAIPSATAGPLRS
jgi:uncharacterized damage-inducible protein DinB